MRRSTAAVLTCGLVLAVGCTDASGERPASDSSARVGTEGLLLDPERVPPAADVAGASPGGTVTVLSAGEIHSLDPTDACCPDVESILTGLVTRSLTQYVYDFERGGMVLIPDIATGLGVPNEDYTEWTYTIRPGVKFEDGTDVTAEDVAYAVKRSFDRTTFGEGWDISNDYLRDGQSYGGPYLSGTDYEGVDVHGDTLTLKASQPFPEMPYYAAFALMSPIPEALSQPDRYRLHPLATGPYKVADFQPKRSLTLVRNDQWDAETDPGRHPYPDRYVFKFGQDQQLVETTLLADASEARTSLTIDNISAAGLRRLDQSGGRDRLELGTAATTFFLSPDNRTIRDVEVRRAIGYAMPYREIWRADGEIPEITRLPATSLLVPGVPGRIADPVLTTRPGQTDPDKAKELLHEAGYENGEYELTFPYLDPDQRDRTNILVEAFERGGFKVSPYRTTSAREFEAVYQDPEGPVNLRFSGWFPAWPSGSPTIPRLYKSDGGYNDAYFSEPSVDDEIDAISTLPLDSQPRAWGELEHRIQAEYYPRIITGYGGVALLRGSHLGGINIDNVTGYPTWENIYVDD